MKLGKFSQNKSLMRKISFLVSLLSVFSLFATAALSFERNVVTLYSEYGSNGSGQGTGFFVGRDGLILTAFHVVDSATRITVVDSENRRYSDVAVVSLLPHVDLALLRISQSNQSYLRLDQSAPSVSERVTVLGTPRGLPQQRLSGEVTSSGFVLSTQLNNAAGRAIFRSPFEVVPLDVTIYNGLSGAPVLNNNGDVVGVLSGSFSEGRGLAWIIPSKHVVTSLNTNNTGTPIDQMLSWPAFDIMGLAWQSMQRRYSKTYSAKHLADLQEAELLFSTLDAIWGGHVATEGYAEGYPWRCWEAKHDGLVYYVDTLKKDDALIHGTFNIAYRRSTNYQRQSGDSNYAKTLHQHECSQNMFGKQIVSRDYILSGPMAARPIPGSKGQFEVWHRVTDCEGSDCNGSQLGQTFIRKINIITSEKLTFGDIILEKITGLR